METSESSNEVKRILKPLCIALILVIFVFISASQSEPDISPYPLDLVENINSQNIFADPMQKARPELPELVFIQDNTFRAVSPPFMITPQVLGALVEGYEYGDTERLIVEYIVESGDSLWSVAAKFNISLNTILWANDLNRTLIRPGQKLVIPPVTGVIHHAKSGDTVGGIAEKYKAKTSDIISFNGLSGEADIFIGDILMVPGGKITTPTKYATTWIPVGTSYFICPISQPCRITQRLHWYNAIDFSHGKCGDLVYAAAGGKVLKVKITQSTSRWAFGGAGNHITILHPNGVVTMYGHIATSFVSPGDEVYQGQNIALMGGQPGTPGAGKSTGCHLHFGVSGGRNPFAY